MDVIEQSLYLHGIGLKYNGYSGEEITFEQPLREAVLGTMLTDNTPPLADLNHQLDVAPWFELIDKTVFCQQHTGLVTVKLSPQSLGQPLYWQVFDNDQGVMASGEALCTETSVCGDYVYQERRYTAHEICLGKLPFGYFQLQVQCLNQEATAQLIVYPETAFNQEEAKYWGLSLQLYSVRSEQNLGIGDFHDLTHIIKQVAAMGAGYILLNPLHALFDNDVDRASPYSPNDRLCLNPLYIDVLSCEDFTHNEQAQALYTSEDFQQALQQEKAATYINYHAVASAKTTLFKLMYAQFLQQACAIRQQAFMQFCQTHQTALQRYANWQKQNISDPAYQDDDFSFYLQWLASSQLEQAQQLCKDLGMSIGLIRDLAVGCAADGNEALSQSSLFNQAVSIGAPPDPWAEQGQNWGLPPMDPKQLKGSQYQHFIALIRANMRHCGALRIDHVMSLLRLWWCILDGEHQGKGCYVYYPFEQLLAILKLESQLNSCAVIGEDLGIVPPEISHALRNGQVYSNILFYFEKDHQGQFSRRQDLKPHALLMIANHDVPTFRAWWHYDDLALRARLGLFDSATSQQQAEQARDEERQRLIAWLRAEDPQITVSLEDDHQTIYSKLVRLLAQSPVQLFTIQLDDLDNCDLPVNIPGTDKEYPNWRRRLQLDIHQLLNNNQLLASLPKLRDL
ncbi:4-alpha-glucanotransferase [Pseudoalteromonas ulvae UL12]|uniref:4-alpha-glucanotransferase n=1 Tax=Pseudoalteromonas ulvae TaxID=107327 RepID=UPI00186B9CFF|nr:4-alpha-glucanotransferase [Pseudoalteromonas ulvae]MBE0366107.1 4-alpha-glucanotransferase [Pseudoalteromonas ulvae UL12]